MGGYKDPGYANNVEQYDGTSWSELSANLATARDGSFGSRGGTAAAALIASGSTPSLTTATEEFTVSVSATTAAAFSSGGNLNTSRRFLGGAGTQTAGLAFGGFQTSPGTNLDNSEEYNGSSWTEGDNINTARRGIEGFGTQTAAVGVGGFPPPGVKTEEYNGSSWTAGNDFGTVRMNKFGTAGLEPAGIIFGGSDTVNAESYDGSSWTEGPNLNTARGNCSGFGSQTAAICFGGEGSPTNLKSVESWNGTAWSEVNDLNTARSHAAGMGTQTAGLCLGGNPGVSQVEQWDGTNFVTHVSLTTARHAMASSVPSPSALGLVTGGDTGSPSNATEELVGESTATRAVKTIDFD